MSNNTGMGFGEFIDCWEKSYLESNSPALDQNQKRYLEGWISLAEMPYSPALNRYTPSNDLSKKIVQILEEKGEYVFVKENNCYNYKDLAQALNDIMLHEAPVVADAIADFGIFNFMLARINNSSVKWYVHKEGTTCIKRILQKNKKVKSGMSI